MSVNPLVSVSTRSALESKATYLPSAEIEGEKEELGTSWAPNESTLTKVVLMRIAPGAAAGLILL